MTSRWSGPAWVGIGAQRSGTTWFTDLLTQHPGIGLARNGRKEQHFFDAVVVDGWDEDAAGRYRDLFTGGPDVLRGEFTPAYLRLPHVPALLRAACPDPPLLIVLLRDPVERFHSAMRWYAAQRGDRPGRRPGTRTHRQFTEQAVWAGMYATHLDVWASVFARDRFLVMQYEAVRQDPAASLALVEDRLGLPPVAPTGTDAASETSTRGVATPVVPGLDEALRRAYRPEVSRLADGWGIDPGRWHGFS
jgi:hypothetical protein